MSRHDPSTESSDARWLNRLMQVDELMRSMSEHTDPQAMVRTFGERMSRLYHSDGLVSISCRNLPHPKYRVTRSHTFKTTLDPWREADKLPVLEGGLLGELLYDGKPRLIRCLDVPDTDPSKPYFDGMGSLFAMPHYEAGKALNMVIAMQKATDGFDTNSIPDVAMISSLFGRATGNLVLSRRLAETNEALNREMRAVADMQRALLPSVIPDVPGLDISAHYSTSAAAGGDYYDFFPLADGRVGMLIADVSGHGTPAAVLMAIMHAIAHLVPSQREHPAEFLAALNRQLSTRYALSTPSGAMFVTAFYAVYDPATHKLVYASAGHNPPRLRVGFTGPGGPVLALDHAQGLPLGVFEDASFDSATVQLDHGDALVLYTDGITETFSPARQMFGTDGLDEMLSRRWTCAEPFLESLMARVHEFAAGAPPADDRTVIVAIVYDENDPHALPHDHHHTPHNHAAPPNEAPHISQLP